MARVQKEAVAEFDSPATVQELIEALTEIREQVGGDAEVRVISPMELRFDGSRVVKVMASPPGGRKGRKR